MHAMKMTSVGVNVSGHTLNKCASTGDGKWSWRWAKPPGSLKVYCLGDLKFRCITYNILASILIGDLFSDSDIFLKFLGIVDQLKAVGWILELIMLSLDGIEEHNIDFGATRDDKIPKVHIYDSLFIETRPAWVLIW